MFSMRREIYAIINSMQGCSPGNPGEWSLSSFPVPRSPGKNHPKIGTFWQKKTKIVAQCTKNKSLTAKASFRIDFGRKKFGLRRLKKKRKKIFFRNQKSVKNWVKILNSHLFIKINAKMIGSDQKSNKILIKTCFCKNEKNGLLLPSFIGKLTILVFPGEQNLAGNWKP